MKLTTTLNKIKQCIGPEDDDWIKNSDQMNCRSADEDISIIDILIKHGICSCLQIFSSVDDKNIIGSYRIALSFAIECAKSVIHIFENGYPNDRKPREAIKSANAVLSLLNNKNFNKSEFDDSEEVWDAFTSQNDAYDSYDRDDVSFYHGSYKIKAILSAAKCVHYTAKYAADVSYYTNCIFSYQEACECMYYLNDNDNQHPDFILFKKRLKDNLYRLLYEYEEIKKPSWE